jgi:putative membrane protein
MTMWGYYGDSGWWWGGMVHMLLMWGVFILIIAALAKWVFGKPANAPHGKTALEILKERYARGEINREEFEQKRRDIEG